jgi:hypothetical protein
MRTTGLILTYDDLELAQTKVERAAYIPSIVLCRGRNEQNTGVGGGIVDARSEEDQVDDFQVLLALLAILQVSRAPVYFQPRRICWYCLT